MSERTEQMREAFEHWHINKFPQVELGNEDDITRWLWECWQDALASLATPQPQSILEDRELTLTEYGAYANSLGVKTTAAYRLLAWLSGYPHLIEPLSAATGGQESEAQAEPYAMQVGTSGEYFQKYLKWQYDNHIINGVDVTLLYLAPPSALAIETAAKLQAAEVCKSENLVDATGTAEDESYSFAIKHCTEAILATIPKDGITELEEFGMLVAEFVVDHCYVEHIENKRSVINMDDLRAKVKSLIGEKK